MIFWLVIAAMTPVAALPPRIALASGFPALQAVELRSKLNLRLIEQPAIEPDYLRYSGMIIETSVAPKAAIGLGLFNVSARKPGKMEPRLEGRRPSSKKVGLNLRLRF